MREQSATCEPGLDLSYDDEDNDKTWMRIVD